MALNVTANLDDPNMQKMADIIDPYGQSTQCLYRQSGVAPLNLWDCVVCMYG